jgi:hypothetical protein
MQRWQGKKEKPKVGGWDEKKKCKCKGAVGVIRGIGRRAAVV